MMRLEKVNQDFKKEIRLYKDYILATEKHLNSHTEVISQSKMKQVVDLLELPHYSGNIALNLVIDLNSRENNISIDSNDKVQDFSAFKESYIERLEKTLVCTDCWDESPKQEEQEGISLASFIQLFPIFTLQIIIFTNPRISIESENQNTEAEDYFKFLEENDNIKREI